MARFRKIPVIVHLHGGELMFTREVHPFIRKTICSAASVIVLNEEERTAVAECCGISPEKISVLRNSINLNDIPFLMEEKSELPRLIYFGRIHAEKGLREIADALHELKKRHYRFRFIVYGSGPDADWFIPEMQEKLGQYFEYKGQVWGKEKWQALNNSDIFLLPSYKEGMPMALLEAMALKKVVIVTEETMMTNIVLHNKNGLVIRQKSSESLAEAIASIHNNQMEQERLGTMAAETIKAGYSSVEFDRNLSAIYSSYENRRN